METEEIIEVKMSVFSRIKGIFINPKMVFEDIKRNPDILKPTLILMAIFIATYLMQLSIIREILIEQLKTAMEVNTSFQITESFLKKAIISGLFAGTIFFAIVPIIKGMICHGVSLINSGKGKLKATISVLVYSYFIVALGQIILAILKIITGNVYLTLSPAVFFSMETNTLLSAWLSYFDIFVVIYLVVSIIGIKIVQELTTFKAASAVLIPSVIYMLMITVPILLGLN
ncbi:YIP1 family protein [Clostridiaceae bacterium HSG29]|nr:YIP1 family protein [Clostridiaceae bacterium HSG29]